MSINYAYNYALVNPTTKMCFEVRTCTNEQSSGPKAIFVQIPTENTDYMFKYYDEVTGQWFLDKEMTKIWIPTDVAE